MAVTTTAAHAELYAEALKAAQAAINATSRHSQGSCGYAWVEIHPGTSSFARWCKASGNALYARRGVHIRPDHLCGYQGQSLDVKEAGATAFAAVLSKAGLKAHAHSRMD